MSVCTTYEIKCDHKPLCDEVFLGGPFLTLAQVRKDARAEGWRRIPGHPTTGEARDLCPQHAR